MPSDQARGRPTEGLWSEDHGTSGWFKTWTERAKQLTTEVYALYLASKDPRTPWYAKVILALVISYAISPIDLIPDFIPVLGYVDDLIIIPAGVSLVRRMIPPEVLEESRRHARAGLPFSRRTKWAGIAIVVLLWTLAAYVFLRLLLSPLF